MKLAVSPVPGILTMYYVDDGTRVEQGETISAVECMKTMYMISAPAAGIVHHKISLGEIVGEGDVVAEITDP
jgi:biotin carboxyl carrier protein